MDNRARYFAEKDIDQIQDWLSQRNLPAIPGDYLPVSGFIVEGVAVGFILFTNSSLGIFDYFISNPKADLKDRSQAISDITESLLLLAKTSGCKAIKCSTRVDSIEEKARHFGFQETGLFKSFFKEL